ncbi:sugar phosphorylase [Candidatus Woesearchaeota archaeon]|nr:sugar phosphorylase [Candidatus Woesearchaeota archaeon]
MARKQPKFSRTRIKAKATILSVKTKAKARANARALKEEKLKSLNSKLEILYGPAGAREAMGGIEREIRTFLRQKPPKLRKRDASFRVMDRFTEKDAILITYPDMIREGKRDTLESLKKFCDHNLKGVISTIHVLPFFPYSSDRGFSVKNYSIVKQSFGTWSDVEDLGENFNLMIDGVFNHISVQSGWFKRFLKGEERYANYFISFPSRNSLTREQLKKIVRPRTNDLLTEFSRLGKKTYVWTTFGKDQADLNFKEPQVLLEVVNVLLQYVHHGASMIRLDAINYLWKEPGTTCNHLRQTHLMIQVLRDVLDLVSPSVAIITETNVPYAKNISYFGKKVREAQMVYNFTLPPLVLHTIYSGSCKYLSKWAARLKYPKGCTYFNFLASHDGIGLTPATRILPKDQIDFLIAEARKHGSLVQKKTVGLGREVPYELNITWWNAVNRKRTPFQVVRYLASRAIALSLQGVPGIYFHSLFGTQNDLELFEKTRVNRDINRKNFHYKDLKRILESDSMPKMIFTKYKKLLRIRAQEKAFHPFAPQKILAPNDQIFSVLRTSMDGREKVLALINITDKEQDYLVKCDELGLNSRNLHNIIKDIPLTHPRIFPHSFTMMLKPYEVVWIKSKA